jgi:hypothetical protein
MLEYKGCAQLGYSAWSFNVNKSIINYQRDFNAVKMLMVTMVMIMVIISVSDDNNNSIQFNSIEIYLCAET